MLKVIIADDERNIREGIKLSIPWAELDLMVVDTCRNGVDAYSSILEYTPDIVITDGRISFNSKLLCLIPRHKIYYIIWLQ